MYEIYEEAIVNESGNKVTMYGIKNEYECYSAITPNKEMLQELCDKCNSLDLDKSHFKYVVEDLIGKTAFDTHGETDR